MQLAKAIEVWVAQNGTGLSSATKRDIETIGTSAAHCGLAKLECSGLSASDRRLLINEASVSSTLSEGAIEEFLDIVLRWGRDRDDPGTPSAAKAATPTTPTEDIDDNDLAVPESPDSEDDDDLADEPDLGGDLDDDYALDDDLAGGYLDTDTDTDTDTEDDDDGDEGDEEEDTAAAAFRAAAAASAVADKEELDVPSLPPGFDEPSRSGAFSAAATVAPKTARGKIDWITVMYFGVAAVCFVFVIILYLSN